ncbi:MAG: hypothetical protein H6658_14515 [Ardenticatenaceae bacterium]|nr:hypothetical protein [Ardenticatenaceae bacterium]
MSNELLQHSLFYGAILSVAMSVTFLILLWINPEMWLDDYPPDIQARFGEMSEKAKRQKRIAAVPVLAFLFGTVVVAAVRWVQAHSGQVTFGDIFWSSFLIFNLFNLVDLLVLDWLIFVTIQPKIAILPGTEGAAGYKNYAFHFFASLKGVGLSLVVSGLVAGVMWLVAA